MIRTFPLALGLALLLQLPAQADVVAREGKGFLEKRKDGRLVLHLTGTPYEMGFQHGKLLAKTIKSNMGKIVDNKGKLGKTKHYQLYKSMRHLMHGMLRKHVPKRFKEEMRGLADGSGLKYAHLWSSSC